MAMSGPFPQFDPYQVPGGPRPDGRQMPAAVRRATSAMFVGGVLSVVSGVWNIHAETAGNSAAVGLVGEAGVFGAAVDLGLWVWMAMANRAGHHWARVTGTVFFGIATLSTLSTVLLGSFVKNLHDTNGNTVQMPGLNGLSIALAIVLWLLGLYATVMMWNKGNGSFYHPETQYGPVGMPAGWQQPGIPPEGYAYPHPYPSVPGQPMPLPDQYTQQPTEPTDPWQQTPQD